MNGQYSLVRGLAPESRRTAAAPAKSSASSRTYASARMPIAFIEVARVSAGHACMSIEAPSTAACLVSPAKALIAAL